MSVPTINIVWAVIAIMVTLSALAIFAFALITFHGKKIKESEAKFSLLFDRVLAPIILIDQGYRVVDANMAFCSLLGYDRGDCKKLRFDDLIPRERWHSIQEEVTKCLASGIDFRGETYMIKKSAELVRVESGLTAIRADGRTYILASFKDIGAYKEVEDALIQKNAALKEVLAFQEEEKLKYKQQIAKTVDNVLAPILSRLVKDDGTISHGHLNSLQENLNSLAEESGGITHAMGKLTPRELEIANLLKGGASSKVIADTLNISIPTVNKHRERIRKKLVIAKKDINLSTYLRKK